MNRRVVSIRIDNRVRIPIARYKDDVVDRLEQQFTYENPMFGEKPGETPTICTMVSENDCYSFPRGGYRRVRELLEGYEYQVEIQDERSTGGSLYWPREFGFAQEFPLWPFQAQAVEAAVSRENCLIRAPTASGKSIAALAMVDRVRLPSLIVVDTGGLRDQWTAVVSKLFGVELGEVGQIGDGKFQLARLTIAMQQSLAKMVVSNPGWIRHFGMLIADEIQHAASHTLYSVVDTFPAKFRIGVSAHEKRQDRKEFLTYDLFGRIAADVAQSDVIKSGKVVDVEVRVIPTQFDGWWYRNAIASGNRFRIRASHHRLLKAMSSDNRRNRLAIDYVEREVKAGGQVLILAERRDHCLMLAKLIAERGIKSGTLFGGVDGKTEFRSVVERIKSGELRVAVGTIKAVGTGIDLPSVDAGVLLSPVGSNEGLFRQIRGRICRGAQGKGTARLYIPWDTYQGRAVLDRIYKWNGGGVVVRNGADWIPLEDAQLIVKETE